MAKSKFTAMNLSSHVPTSSSSAKSLILSKSLEIITATGKRESRMIRNSRSDAASSSQALKKLSGRCCEQACRYFEQAISIWRAFCCSVTLRIEFPHIPQVPFFGLLLMHVVVFGANELWKLERLTCCCDV